MKLFDSVFQARFVSRPNRFLIRCEWNKKTISAFLPNPGRLQELLLPGSLLSLIEERGPGLRKTRYTVVAVERDGHPIMLHTHRTNDVARHLIQNGKVPGLENTEIVKSEVRVGRNRFDFLLRDGAGDLFLEVKSCTLVGERVAMFPDAVTERGTRHLIELARLSEQGMRTAVLFIVHWRFARFFMPDYHTDLTFSQTLLRVKDRVQVLPVAVRWNRDLSLSSGGRLLEIPWSYVEEEAKDRGSYLLILKLEGKRKIHVGQLGELPFRKGFYIYAGSAMANLTKRLERHRRIRKRRHWHIDELRDAAEFHAVLPIRSSARLECEIAEALSRMAEWSVPGFGSSDCSCATHLFGMGSDPLRAVDFQRLLQYFRMDRYSPLTLSSF